MRSRGSLNNFLSNDRKTLYIILSIVMISVLTLTVVYAALSTTLNITGNAEVTAASWDIYLDNVQLNSNSSTSNIPTISDKTTASFSTTLSEPGDFYEFTIDVVNNGSIDAMIDSVTKTPTLTEAQAKYLNYTVEYENGESINTKQLVSKNSFVRIKVKIGFRTDISSSDIPKTSETLNLSFKVNYTQSDETGVNVKDDGVKKSLDIISGDLETVGSEVAIGDERFYVMSNSNGQVKMLAKNNITLETTPKQSSSNSTVKFSTTNYWFNGTSLKSQYGTSYPTYVYDSNSNIYNYIENYKIYLESQGTEIEEAYLIKKEELEALGCSKSSVFFSCLTAPSWVYSTWHWTGTAYNDTYMFTVVDNGALEPYLYSSTIGIRPVIVVKS